MKILARTSALAALLASVASAALSHKGNHRTKGEFMKRLLAVGVVLGAMVVTVLAVLPLSAGANSDRRFVVAIRGNLNSDTDGSGTFTAGGAISTSGTFDAPFTATPINDRCSAIKGDWIFTAPDGSFTFHGSGRGCGNSPDDPHPVNDFTFKITAGTGAYASLAGRGSATGVVDFTDGTFTTIFDGRAKNSH
jgi:hypothetical protein